MANTQKKNSGTANPGQNPGREKNGGPQNQNPVVEDNGAHLSETQATATNESEKPRKGRGRPKKATTADTPAVDMNKQSAPTNATTRKRVRDNVPSVDEETNQPASKRTKADDTGIDHLPQPQRMVGGLRKAAEVAPRDPLPDRIGRNVHPAPKKATRRSSQEVAAEREVKRKAIENKIKELENAKHRLAEMNAFEDVEDDAMDEANPQRFSAAIRKRRHIELESSSNGEESFDFEGIDEALGSSESEEPVQKTVVSLGNVTPLQRTRD